MDYNQIFTFLLVGLVLLLAGFKHHDMDNLDLLIKLKIFSARLMGIVCTIVGIVGLILKLFSGS